MTIFDDIRLEWKGRTYIVPSRRVMGAILCVEDVVTMNELHRYSQRGAIPLGKIAAAYAAVLRYAGANVSDEEVYLGLFEDENVEIAMLSCQQLLSLMLPKLETLQSEVKQGNGLAAGRRSSRRRSRQPSAADG